MITTFTALAEPNRQRILACLRRGSRTVNGLADELDLRQPQTSKHLSVLHAAHLVRMEKKGTERHYALDPKGFAEIEVWIAPYLDLWRDRFAALDAVLADLTPEISTDDK